MKDSNKAFQAGSSWIAEDKNIVDTVVMSGSSPIQRSSAYGSILMLVDLGFVLFCNVSYYCARNIENKTPNLVDIANAPNTR